MAQKRPPLTHFLCIPLVTPTSRPQLSRSLAAFRDDVVAANEPSMRVPAAAVRPLGTLHLTLGVMSLREEERLREAVALLEGLRMGDLLADVQAAALERVGGAVGVVGSPGGRKVVEKEVAPLAISLRGLLPMQKPAQATVLYAPPHDSRGYLHAFCEKLRGAFMDAGLIIDEGRPLLLHATIVNTIYAKGRGAGGNGGRGRGKDKALTLDARNLLDRYDEYVWMEDFLVDRVAICKMGAKEVEGGEEGDEGDGAAYEVVAEVAF